MSKKILLIDKDDEALNILRSYLILIGYDDVIIAQSGGDAWALLQAEEFFAVIAAWDLYEVSGLDLLIIFRRDNRFNKKLYFLTKSDFSQADVIKAGQAGVSGLIVNPCEPDILKRKLLRALTRKQPSEEESLLTKGLVFAENGEYEKALEVLYNLLKNGECAELYYNIGYVKTAQKKYCEAIDAFMMATELDRTYAKAFRALGDVYRKMGRSENAEEYLQKAADIYLDNERDSEAEDVLKELININPNTTNAYNSLGILYRKKGAFEKSLYFYKKALKIQPDGDYIFYNIGKLYIKLKDYEQARVYLERALALNPHEYDDIEGLLIRLDSAI